MKFSIKNFFSKCDQIHRKLRIGSHLLKKSFMENFIFFAALQCRLKLLNQNPYFCRIFVILSLVLVTNPIDVVKVRLQLDNQLCRNKNIFENRYYRGFLRGGWVIIADEGIRGLYKGYIRS